MSFSYDAAGNLTSDGIHSYTYDAEGNVLLVDGGAQQFVYDALNRRIRMQGNGYVNEYVYDYAGRRISTWNPSTNSGIEGRIYWGGALAAFRAIDGTTYFDHQDWLGAERLRTNYAGTAVSTYASLPWGDGFAANLPGNDGDQDQQHFALLEHDTESNTEHAQFRQYSSTQGRWMSPDPYDGSYDAGNPQSMNRYSYVLNNPLRNIDPTGLSCITLTDEDGNETLADDGDGNGCADAGVGADGSVQGVTINVNGDCDDGCVTYVNYVYIDNTQITQTAGTNAPDKSPHYTMADVCAASTLLNKGGQTALDLLGVIPGENTVLKGAQFLGGLISAGITIFGPSSPTDAVFTGIGSGITAVDVEKVMTTGAKAVPVVGNVVSGIATINDIYGKEGMGAYYDDCIAGKN
jgi:RHS repeat-associated protein